MTKETYNERQEARMRFMRMIEAAKTAGKHQVAEAYAAGIVTWSNFPYMSAATITRRIAADLARLPIQDRMIQEAVTGADVEQAMHEAGVWVK